MIVLLVTEANILEEQISSASGEKQVTPICRGLKMDLCYISYVHWKLSSFFLAIRIRIGV